MGLLRRPLILGQLPTPDALLPAQAGETWTFQGWHRNVVQASTSSSTGGVEVVF